MTTPFPQAVLEQAAKDAAANTPKNILDIWVNKIKALGGTSAPASSSSAAQVARDAKAGGEAMRNYGASQVGGGKGAGLLKNAGGLTTALSVGATIGTNMRETMPQSTFVSGRGAGARATDNARKNSPDPEYSTAPAPASSASFADLRGSATPESMEPAASNLGEGAAMDAAERSRPGAGYPAGVTRPADYPVQAGGRGAAAPLDPNNTGARGTSMTYDRFMKDIAPAKEKDGDKPARTGFEVRDTFQAENLPGTPAHKEAIDVNSGENEGLSDKNKAASAASKSSMASTPAVNAVLEGAKSAKLEDDRQLALDKLARRRAFLDASDSQRGLRAVEGLQGLVTQGGQNFVRDSSAEGGLRQINQDEYRKRRRGNIIPAAKAKATARTEKVNKQKDA
jgi:hypothetical protein